ncbi:MAG TPA: hypothetical protein VD999_07785 [Vitreimonas sp.]|nr:hypothetical protein [Vitreimonas sp.]
MRNNSTYLSTGDDLEIHGTETGRISGKNLLEDIQPGNVQVFDVPSFIETRTHLQDVINFHEHFGLDKEVAEKPNFLPADLDEVRANFLQEELNEYCASIGLRLEYDGITQTIKWVFSGDSEHVNLENALDGLIDLQYVLLGTVHLHGFAPIWNTAWNRVQAANMSKVRVERAEDSKRGTTHDVRKPEGWVAPQFKDLLFY